MKKWIFLLRRQRKGTRFWKDQKKSWLVRLTKNRKFSFSRVSIYTFLVLSGLVIFFLCTDLEKFSAVTEYFAIQPEIILKPKNNERKNIIAEYNSMGAYALFRRNEAFKVGNLIEAGKFYETMKLLPPNEFENITSANLLMKALAMNDNKIVELLINEKHINFEKFCPQILRNLEFNQDLIVFNFLVSNYNKCLQEVFTTLSLTKQATNGRGIPFLNILLKTKKINLNIQDSNGETPFSFALKSRSLEIIKLYLEYGAEPNEQWHLEQQFNGPVSFYYQFKSGIKVF